MAIEPTRRSTRATALATGIAPLLPAAARAANPAKRLVAGTRTLDVHGKPARVS